MTNLPYDLSAHFRRFRDADPERLHFAAHSHHYWPDVTEAAQAGAWSDAARFADDKWGPILGAVWPDVSAGIAGHLNLPDAGTLVPAPNTHEFLKRLLSALPAGRVPKIVATDGEFHTFRRQIDRLLEDGLVALTSVPAEPFATLAERLADAARKTAPELVFVSQVLFNSGFALTDPDRLVGALSAPDRLVVIDGYHGYLARPTDLSGIADKAFYIAGGYKYAMAGEGACFMHCPPGFGRRPRDTGWYASFGTLAGAQSGITYAEDGRRFMGATFDPSGLYRMRAVLGWLAELQLDAAKIHAHALALQEIFVAAIGQKPFGALAVQNLVLPVGEPARGNFLTFRHPEAEKTYAHLHENGIVTDVRGDRLRVGFGLYQNAGDVERLVGRLATIG